MPTYKDGGWDSESGWENLTLHNHYPPGDASSSSYHEEPEIDRDCIIAPKSRGPSSRAKACSQDTHQRILEGQQQFSVIDGREGWGGRRRLPRRRQWRRGTFRAASRRGLPRTGARAGGRGLFRRWAAGGRRRAGAGGEGGKRGDHTIGHAGVLGG